MKKDEILSKTIDELNQLYKEKLPMLKEVNFQILEIKEGYVKVKVYHTNKIERYGGIVFGGVIAMLFDAFLGLAVMSVNDKNNQATIALQIEFLRKAKDEYYIIETRVDKKGRNIVFVSGKLVDSKEQLLAEAMGQWFIFD
jgi:uncharacterized protein (TIGR00369 family)